MPAGRFPVHRAGGGDAACRVRRMTTFATEPHARVTALTAERDPLDRSNHYRDRTACVPRPELNILRPPLIHAKIDAPKWRGSGPAARDVITDPLTRR